MSKWDRGKRVLIFMHNISNRLQNYFELTRLNKPIGILLLLWPTLTALWIASPSIIPDFKYLVIFILGVVLTRSAGCILNDLADQRFDSHVERTKNRPLASKKISRKEAWILCASLLLCAFLLVLLLNPFTILLAVVAAALTAIYPLTKRVTQLPQLVLGITFNMGILMAFTAVQDEIPAIAWVLYFTALLWTIVYDTMYGLVDREDDLKIGVKSTAILFGSQDSNILAVLQLFVCALLILLGHLLEGNNWFYVSIVICAGFFVYQQYLIRQRSSGAYLQAFLNNHWAWLVVLVGVVLSDH